MNPFLFILLPAAAAVIGLGLVRPGRDGRRLVSCLFLGAALLLATGIGSGVVSIPLFSPAKPSSESENTPAEGEAGRAATSGQDILNDTEDRTADPGFYPVREVVDGDTIKVRPAGGVEIVRLIGVDTPEVKHPERPVECFGRAASRFTRRVLEGQMVRLERDATQENRDRYGRLLRYVYLMDGTDLSHLLIRRGYGYEYTYRIPYREREKYRAAEREARQAKRGLWAEDACRTEVDQ